MRLTFGVLALIFVSAGCGGDPPAGMDAGRDTPAPMVDAPMELPDTPPPAPECVGAPPPCGTLDNAECATVMGCQLATCRGFPITCDRLTDATACGTQMGCSWSGTACLGTATACTALMATACAAQMGCTPGAERCGGTAIDCELLPRASCASQPGCTEQLEDAGPIDAPPQPCEPGSTAISVRVVGPDGAPLAGTPVRAEGDTCRIGFEATTAADGTVTFMVDETLGPWSVTAARAGYTAVSVLDVLSFAFTGDLALQPLPAGADMPFAASGTLAGSVGIGNTVRIDAPDFDTIEAAGATWSSTHYVTDVPTPLQFVAVELDAAGRAVNFASTPATARPSAAVSGVSLVLPAPAEAAREHRIAVNVPSSGLLADVLPSGPGAAHHVLDLPGEPYVVVGSASWDTTAVPTLVVRDFAPLPADWVIGTLLGATHVVNVYLRGEVMDGEITIGALDDLSWGFATALGDATATARASGFGHAAMHLGEDATSGPRWRVFGAIPAGGTARLRVPFLPSGVSAADLGLSSFVSCLLLAIETEDGVAPWSLEAANVGVLGYRATAAASYVFLDATDR